jgi:SAM-dependent methyltransferase
MQEDAKSERIAREFTKVPFYQDLFLIRHHLYKDLCALRPFLFGGRWLDVGCGIKPYEGIFDRVECYIGLDHPLSLKGHYGMGTRSDVWGDAAVLPFKSNSFDGVLSIFLMEHLQNSAEHLRETCRVLKIGGKLLISAPFVWPLHGEPWDFARYTSFGLIQLVERAGFRVEKIKAQGGAWSAAGQMIIVSLLFGALLPKTPWGRILGWVWKMSLVPVINGATLILDQLFPEGRWVLSYLVVAQKIEENKSCDS